MNSLSKIPRRRKGDNYNGWKNHATWCVDFHLSNDQLLYNELRELVSKAIQGKGKKIASGGLPKKTEFTTKDGKRVYDLDPSASELWAVAGPDGHKGPIDSDALPKGFRWVEDAEWEALRAEATETLTQEEHIRYSLADDLKGWVNGLCNEAIYGNDRHLSDPVKCMAWDMLSGYLEEVDWDEIASAWIEAEAGGEL